MQSSIKNLAYLGTCFMASNKGMFTSTFLKAFKSSLSWSFLLGLARWLGKGGRIVEAKGYLSLRLRGERVGWIGDLVVYYQFHVNSPLVHLLYHVFPHKLSTSQFNSTNIMILNRMRRELTWLLSYYVAHFWCKLAYLMFQVVDASLCGLLELYRWCGHWFD